MSLHPHVVEPVPAETARVAHAAFPKGHPYLTFRDALGTFFQDEDFTALFPRMGPTGLAPMAAGAGDDHAVSGKPGGSPGGGGRPRADRLEVSAESRVDRSRLRLFGAERLPGAPARGQCRRVAPRQAASALPGAGAADGPGPAAHRLDARPRRDSRAQPTRTR